MNFKSIINDVCCDSRIKNGVLDIKNADHVFVLQEYLEKCGIPIDEIVDKTAGLFEAGRFPERQAYNKDGILVTFPNKEYRDRAVNKGTHFADNPKKADVNIFAKKDGEPQTVDDTTSSDSIYAEKPKDVSIDKELDDKIVDTDSDDRNKTEKQIDAKGVDAILTGQVPLVNYSVDEAVRYGFYKKGMSWYNSEGNLVGEQIYDEITSKNVIVSEAISPSLYMKKIEKVRDLIDRDLLLKLQFLKNLDKTSRTKIFETIPILTAYGITDYKNLQVSGDYNPFAIKFLSDWANLRDKLENITDPKSKEENIKIYDVVDKDLKDIGGVNGVSLAQLGTPTDFFHESIKEFYSAAADYNSKFLQGKKTKENTADVVFIYDGKKSDVISALKAGNIDNQDIDSMAKIKDKDIKFALISLKAGSSRLGGVLTQLAQYVGQSFPTAPVDEPINEGLIDTINTSIKTAIDKVKNIPDLVKNYYRSFISVITPFSNKISNFFFKELNVDVSRLQSTELKNLENIEKNIEKEIGNLDEGKNDLCDAEHAPYTDSISKNLSAFKSALKSNTEDTRLITKIIELSNNKQLIENFPINIKKVQLSEIKRLKENLIYTIDQIESDYDINDCLERDTLRPIFKYRGNILALKYIDLILNSVLKDLNTSNPEVVRQEFIKLSSLLSSEAVFGRNVSLPLIKFTGSKIEKLKYKSNFKLELPDKYKDVKLGKININVITNEGYLTVNLYLFTGITMKDDVAVPTYINYLMDSNSGSTFTFKVEGQKVVEKL